MPRGIATEKHMAAVIESEYYECFGPTRIEAEVAKALAALQPGDLGESE